MAITTSISALSLDVLRLVMQYVDDPGTTMPVSKKFLSASEICYKNLFREYSAEGSLLHTLGYPERALAATQTAPGFTIGNTNHHTTYQWPDRARVQYVFRAVLSDARNIGGGDQIIIETLATSASYASTRRQMIDPCKLNALANWITWEKDYNLILWFYPISVPASSVLIAQAFWNDPDAARMRDDLINSTADFATFAHDMRKVPEHQITAHALAEKIREYIGANLVSFEREMIRYVQARTTTFRDPTEHLTLLPEEIGFMRGLKWLMFGRNNIMTLPQSILILPHLSILMLANCHLRSIPKEINQLTKLDILMLEHNELTTLPNTIVELPNLAALNLSGNRLTDLPPMYRLEELTDLDLIGNPVIEGPDFPPNAALSYKTSLFTYSMLKLHIELSNPGREPYLLYDLLKKVVLPPAFIGIALISIIEGIFRGIAGLIAQSIYLFLPQGEVRNFFTRDVLPQTWGSFGFCFRFTIVSLCLLVQNFYKNELNLKETDRLVKSYVPFL